MKPGSVRGAFFYPPADLVLAGKVEDNWARHQWFTWPGNQFAPGAQQAKFASQVSRIARQLDLDVALDSQPIYTDDAIHTFIVRMEREKPDALLLFNFWNSFSPKLRPIIESWKGPIILYQPLGTNHQLPPELFRTAPRLQYIHSIENWDALERGLRAVRAASRMAQSRLLRVSGQVTAEKDEREPFFDLPIHTVPASTFNTIYDTMTLTSEMQSLARKVRRNASHVSELAPEAFTDAVRSHAAVREIMARYEADAITIECLFLKHRKPCLSFAINNGNLVPCGCENHLDPTLTLMLGVNCFERGGFQHNPEYDTEANLYFGSHCTCTTRLHGPNAKSAPYLARPFFHQMPKTLALDVQWPVGETVTLCKYQGAKQVIDAWRGKVISSPTCPPTGGCATRVLVKLDDVKDICTVYPGPHPVLYCGDYTRHLKAFAQLYSLPINTNC